MVLGAREFARKVNTCAAHGRVARAGHLQQPRRSAEALGLVLRSRRLKLQETSVLVQEQALGLRRLAGRLREGRIKLHQPLAAHRSDCVLGHSTSVCAAASAW